MYLIKVNQMKYQKKLKMNISRKELAKDLINKFSIFNGAKYFSLGISQNYFSGTTQIDPWKSSGMS